MYNVFVSYHHAYDQAYKNELALMNARLGLFVDYSVNTGEISDELLSDETIRTKIRDDYLRDSTVTIVLVGVGTSGRKHVDWEIYSSMFDGSVNKKSGILVINLPSVACTSYYAGHGEEEKANIYPETTSWMNIDNRQEYETRYPFMPARIIDNLLMPRARLSVVPWEKIYSDPAKLSYLVELAHRDRALFEYDLSRAMRRANS